MLAILALGFTVLPPVFAGESGRPWSEEELKAHGIQTLSAVWRSGGAREEGGVAGGCPPVVSSHTSANFEGGQFVVQAGFGETEIAAVSYALPAAAFPIQIDLTEFILATSGSTQTTTTHWSVMFWSGTPQTGTQVGVFSSDDVILPHAVIPQGTNGVNIQFSVDPGDPEQIIINDDGSHIFSIGYRIDQHNQQTQNPCFVSPPTCCNAFPTTDVGGLQQPANNWLFGLNCGSFGCPANGGWARFSQLPGFCRPSGDWVMRATWHSLECAPASGACCLPSGACVVTSPTACSAQGGSYQGDSSQCGTCPQPNGACCFASTGGCLLLNQSDCVSAGGVWRGAGTACGQIVCFPRGACCLPDGSCAANQSPEECAALGGTFQGNNVSCASANCPPPVGACCLNNGTFCLTLSAADCTQAGGAWAGMGTACNQGGPLITQQPQSQAVCEGAALTLSVQACGAAPIFYQWRRNLEDIAGANSATYSVQNAGPGDAGSYDVIVGNSSGNRQSDAAVVTVTQRCDANCDGTVNNFDIDAFVLAITAPSEWQQQYSCGYVCANDTNEDQVVNNFDIDLFVECLTGG